MLRSIVLGANGQDGSYLCELLAASGQQVIGVGRQPDYTRPLPNGRFQYVQIDLCDREALRAVLTSKNPLHIYHVAAVHGESGFCYEGVVPELFSVGVLSTHVCLEYLRETDGGRLFYASSAKVFGDCPKHTITESSAKRADCIYSTAKIAAGHLIDCYRRDHGIHAIVAYLFNHESPRRGAAYFVPKIARALANGLAGYGDPLTVDSLAFFADWGSAEEYMDMSMRAMQLGLDGSYIFATGQTVWAAAAVEAAFDRHKLDYRDWLRFPEVKASAGTAPFIADASRLTDALGYVPQRRFSQLVDEIAAENFAH
jgi:GDPmannose 4,6-dehydratase